MKKIFTNMLPYWHMVLAVLALLIVQAYCDLSLPQYTSDMIDIGIQNHGISYIMPEKMTVSEMAYSQLYMTEAEAEEWSSRYDKDGDLYVRRSMSGGELSDANDRFMIPVILTYQSRNTSEEEFRKTLSGSAKEGFDPNKMTLEEIEKAMDTDLSIHTEKNEDGDEKVYVDMRPMMLGMDKEQLTAIRQKLETTVDTIGSSTMKSRGIAYAIACDKEAGVDIDSLQKKYLWTQGFKMFVMAVIMLAAAVGAGYLASKVGAGVGRDLREKIFRRVISYSNTEMDKFSTASLITRSTNDVQQIQMVTAVLLRMLMYAPIIGIGGVIKVLNTGAHMGWIIIAAVCAILFLVALLIILAMPKFKAMQTLVDGLNLVSREILTGLPVIRAHL